MLLDDASPDETGHATDHNRPADVNGHAPNTTGDADATRPVTRELVEQNQSELQFLRDELRAQRQQHTAAVAAWQERLREAHVLLAQQRALPGPTSEIAQMRKSLSAVPGGSAGCGGAGRPG